jgi:acetylornithine deacetylase/succinyl-diaminopimelate desuccinylase-like protein
MTDKKNKKIKNILDSVRWNEVKNEAIELLSNLIKIDTTNPPGNEKPAAELLEKYLQEFGIKTKIVESEKDRASIIAELEGEKNSKPLILLSHLDVVPANPKEWSFPPFSGEIKNGYIWGRGAIDCKGLAVVEAVALSLVKRMGIRIQKGVKFISVADEEMGGEKGAKFVVENFDEDANGFCVINEGGAGFIIKNRKIYMPCFGEKGPIWLKIKAKGKPGHASMPHKDNPNLILIQALYKILNTDFGKKLTDNFIKSIEFYLVGNNLRKFLKPAFNLIQNSEKIKELLGKLIFIATSPKQPKISSMFSNTLSVTIMKSGYKENVIPEEAEAIIDMRLIPGYQYDEIIDKMRKVVDDPRISFEILAVYEPSQSDPASEIMMKIRESAYYVLEAPFLPILATGFTDSRFFRKKGIPAYGFLPFFFTEEEISTMHGIDERISIENIELGLKIMLSIILNLCADEHAVVGA